MTAEVFSPELLGNSILMMRDRGYSLEKVLVLSVNGNFKKVNLENLFTFHSDGTHDLNKKEFKSNYGKNGNLTFNAIYKKIDDEKIKTLVSFVSGDENSKSVGVPQFNDIFKLLEEREPNFCIFIIDKPLTAKAKSDILIKNNGAGITIFLAHELVPPNHILQPEYVGILRYVEILSEENAIKVPSLSLVFPKDVKKLVKEMDPLFSGEPNKITSLPYIFEEDPLCKYYGLVKGQVIRFKRESLGRTFINEYFYYRLVVQG